MNEDNPFKTLQNSAVSQNNPFLNLGQSDVVGTRFAIEPKTNFAKLQDAKAMAEETYAEAKKKNSFLNLAYETIKPTSLYHAAVDIGSSIKKDPFQATESIVGGLTSGVTLGGSDYLFKKVAEHGEQLGLKPDTVNAINQFLHPSDPVLSGVRNGFDIAGSVLPYAAAESIVAKGLKYMDLPYLKAHATVNQILTNIGAFNIAGQINEAFKETELKDRLKRAGFDTALAVLLPIAAKGFRAVRGTGEFAPPKPEISSVVKEFADPDYVRTALENSKGGEEALFQGKTPPPEYLSSRLNDLAEKLDYHTQAIGSDAHLGSLFRERAQSATSLDQMIKIAQDTFNEFSSGGGTLKVFHGQSEGGGAPSADKLSRGAKFFSSSQGEAASYGKAAEATLPKGGWYDLDVDPQGLAEQFKNLQGKEASQTFLDFLNSKGYNGFKQASTLGNNTIEYAVNSNGNLATGAMTPKGNVDVTGGLDVSPRYPENTEFKQPTKISPVIDHAGEPHTAGSPKVAVTTEIDGKPVTVATNDLDALQNYVRGTGRFEYKIETKDSLGKDAAGNDIQARHTFDSKTGTHVIQVTNATTAGNLAHEFGHIFDAELVANEGKLSSLIANFDRNRPRVEDLLSSFGVKQLADQGVTTITPEAISGEIKNIVKSLGDEIESLSVARRGVSTASPSEKFADAVSELVTNKANAPVLRDLLAQAKLIGETDLFSPKVQKVVQQTIEFPKNPTQKVTIKPLEPTATVVVKNPIRAAGGEVIVEKGASITPIKQGFSDFKFKTADGKSVVIQASPKQTLKEAIAEHIEGDPNKIVKDFRKENKQFLGKPMKVVEKPLELERTKTGKKPKTPAVRAETMTSDSDTEVFINTKILPKLKGVERIGKSNANILEGALKSNLTEESFNKMLTQRFGNLSEDVQKGKQILVDQASQLKESLNGRDIGQLSGDELRATMSDYNRLVQSFEVFAGIRTELSNTFRSLGIATQPGENDILRDALTVIQKAIGAEKDPFKIMGKVMETRTSNIVEKYFEIWYPSLLSGWKTSARNILGNASNLATQTISNLFTSQGRSEFFPRVMAIIDANKEGLNVAAKVLKGDKNILSKYYEPAVPKEPIFSETGKFAFMNKLEYVGRFLNAQDAYFSNAFKASEVAANRVGGFTYGLENKAAIDAINDSVGTFAGQQGTFRNAFENTFVGEIANRVSSLKNSKVNSVKTFGNFIFPFVKTIANITDRRIDFVPLLNTFRTFGGRELYLQRATRIIKDAELFDKLYKQGKSEGMDLGAAKTFATDEVERVKEIVIDRLKNQQMGRFYMGLAATAAATPLALAGRITGTGPTSKNERAVLMKTGWRPNSIILPNGVALPYQNLALPLSSILSLMGNISDAVKYGKSDSSLTDTVFQGLKGFMRSELDQSFLSGLSSIYDTIYGYQTAGQLISQFGANAIPIPAAWTQTKDVLFPERYDARTFNEQISAKLGSPVNIFNGNALQPKLDAFGDQTKADLIYGLTPPLLNSKTDDSVLNFMRDKGVFIGKPQIQTKIKGLKGQERAITPEEYTNYVRESGQQIYDKLKSRIESGYFNRFDTQKEIKKEVDKIVGDIRTRQKNKIKF